MPYSVILHWLGFRTVFPHNKLRRGVNFVNFVLKTRYNLLIGRYKDINGIR